MEQVICPYCNKATMLVTGEILYPHRKDLKKRSFYLCKKCDAYVGCFWGTENPMGTPADKELRELRVITHGYFDQLWKRAPKGQKKLARTKAYKIMASEFKMTDDECHIGKFNFDVCLKVHDWVLKKIGF